MITKRTKGFEKGNTVSIMSGLRLHGPGRESSATRAWKEQAERYGVPLSGGKSRQWRWVGGSGGSVKRIKALRSTSLMFRQGGKV